MDITIKLPALSALVLSVMAAVFGSGYAYGHSAALSFKTTSEVYLQEGVQTEKMCPVKTQPVTEGNP